MPTCSTEAPPVSPSGTATCPSPRRTRRPKQDGTPCPSWHPRTSPHCLAAGETPWTTRTSQRWTGSMADPRNDSPLFDADAILRKAYFGVGFSASSSPASPFGASSAIPIGRGRCPSSRPRSHWPRTTACASRIAVAKPCSWQWRPWCSSWSRAQCSASPCAWPVLDNDLRVPPAGFEPATPALGERCSIP
jgi:hypothetical protein